MRMLAIAGKANHQVLEELSPKERKAYRERFRYWTQKKGFDPEMAHEKASQLLLKPKKHVLPKNHAIQLREPTRQQIDSVIKELRQDRNPFSIPQAVAQAGQLLPFPSHPERDK